MIPALYSRKSIITGPMTVEGKILPARAACVLAVILLAAAGCSRPEPVEQAIVIGGVTGAVSVAITDLADTEALIDQAVGSIRSSILLLDDRYPDSEIAKINRVATSVRLPVTQSTFRALDLGRHYSAATAGLFDYTLGTVQYLWGFNRAVPPIAAPTPAVLSDVLNSTGIDNVTLFDDGAIAITSPRCRIQLGRYLYAYAVDVAIVAARRQGYRGLRLSLDGAARTHGVPAPESAWTTTLSMTKPDRTIGTFTHSVNLPAVVALGLYDHTVTIAGVEYSSIIDPETGKPAEGVLFAAAAGPLASRSHALAEAAIIGGRERISRILTQSPDYELAMVEASDPATLLVTAGMEAQLRPSPAYATKLQRLERQEPGDEEP